MNMRIGQLCIISIMYIIFNTQLIKINNNNDTVDSITVSKNGKKNPSPARYG